MVQDAVSRSGWGWLSASSAAAATSASTSASRASSSSSRRQPRLQDQRPGPRQGIPLRPGPPAPPRSGTCARRRTWSGSRGGSRGRGAGPGPCRARQWSTTSPAARYAVHEVGAVTLANEQIREAGHELGDAPAGGLDLDRDGDGVAVVLDHEDDRQLQVAGGVQRLPELALGGGAVAGGDHDDLVVLRSS